MFFFFFNTIKSINYKFQAISLTEMKYFIHTLYFHFIWKLKIICRENMGINAIF